MRLPWTKAQAEGLSAVRAENHSCSLSSLSSHHDKYQKPVCGNSHVVQWEWESPRGNFLSTHAGTHVDAPWHYTPTSEGKPARKIDEMPLEWYYGDGVVLDVRHKPRGSAVTVDDFKQALAKIDYTLKSADIVLVETGTDRFWGKPEYNDEGCGMTRESTLWLIGQGIRVMGTDAWGWDRPFWAIRDEFAVSGDKGILWGGHFAGIEKEYCHIEKLANLDKLPRPFGFKVACFPIKITAASGGWARVVAIFED